MLEGRPGANRLMAALGVVVAVAPYRQIDGVDNMGLGFEAAEAVNASAAHGLDPSW